MSRRLALLVAALAFPAFARAQTTAPAAQSTAAQSDAAPGFTLDDALRAQRRSHPLLASSQALARAADHDVTAAGLWTNPVLSAAYTRSVGFTTYDPRIGMPQVTVSQLIETAGLPSARRDAAMGAREAARADVNATALGLAWSLHDAALQLASAQARVQIHREAVDDLAHASQVVQARVAAGAAAHYDASRMVIALTDARAQLAEAEADALHARATLDVTVGPDATTLVGPLRVSLDEPLTLPPLAELMNRLDARPDLVAAQARARSQGAMVDVARRSVTQGITVSLGSVVGAGTGDQQQVQVDVMAGVSVPLALVDRGQGTIPAAEQRAEAARRTVDAITLASRQQVAGAWREVERRREALDAWRSGGTSGVREMRHEAEVAYREGRLSILELVDAYTSFRDARLREVVLSLDARSAEVSLGRAAGVATWAVTAR